MTTQTLWQTTKPAPPPDPEVLLELGRCRFHIGRAYHDPRLWQHLMITVGEHSERSLEECQQSWPREAIAIVRAELAKLEEELNARGL